MQKYKLFVRPKSAETMETTQFEFILDLFFPRKKLHKNVVLIIIFFFVHFDMDEDCRLYFFSLVIFFVVPPNRQNIVGDPLRK